MPVHFHGPPMLYNIDVSLWRNHTPRGSMRIIDGHLFEGAEGAVARFADDAAAMRTMREAGFVPIGRKEYTEWVRPVPRRGLTFEHARVQNPDGSPMKFAVTQTRLGHVYYRPVGGGGGQCCEVTGFHQYIKRIVDDAS